MIQLPTNHTVVESLIRRTGKGTRNEQYTCRCASHRFPHRLHSTKGCIAEHEAVAAEETSNWHISQEYDSRSARSY